LPYAKCTATWIYSQVPSLKIWSSGKIWPRWGPVLQDDGWFSRQIPWIYHTRRQIRFFAT
jgi:hypothetical protein